MNVSLNQSLPTPIEYRSAIDGLRCVAVVWVMLHNASHPMLGDERASALYIRLFDLAMGPGWLGVQLFFVLSGYLVTTILLESRGQKLALPVFMARRILRIFPVYFLFLAFFILMLAPLDGMPGWISKLSTEQFWYWTYSLNWIQPFPEVDFGLPHLWSLAVEEQFYLVWPLVVLFLPVRSLAWTFIVVIVFATVLRTTLILSGEEWMVEAGYSWTICRIDALAAGGLLAYAMKYWQPRMIHFLWLTGVSGFLALLVLIIEHQFVSHRPGVGIMNQLLGTLVFSGILGLILMKESEPFIKWLCWKPVVAIGRVSYAVYLFHFPFFLYWFGLDLIPSDIESDALRFVAILVNLLIISIASVALAGLSWILFERPILNLKRYLPYNR